jgi:hypothetical protein
MLLCAGHVLAQETSTAAWSHFIGEWEGKGTGEPGQSSGGGFTFAPDLSDKILVRRNFAEYAATQSKPAYRHEDLMVTYFDPQSHNWRADYWDNEGHIIHYTAQLSDQGRSAVFVSDPAPRSPAFRLTYTAESANDLAIKFEIAPPDKPGQFATYITARVARKAGTKH